MAQLIVIGHVMDRKLDIELLVDNSWYKCMRGTEIKEQFIDMLNSDVSAICVYEIRALLLKDKDLCCSKYIVFPGEKDS